MLDMDALKVKELIVHTIDCIIFITFAKLGRAKDYDVFRIGFFTSRSFPKLSKLYWIDSYVRLK